MWFASASDGGGLWEGDILAARTAKEAASLEHWRREAGGLTSLRDLHAWLHGTHQCYAVARQRGGWFRVVGCGPDGTIALCPALFCPVLIKLAGVFSSAELFDCRAPHMGTHYTASLLLHRSLHPTAACMGGLGSHQFLCAGLDGICSTPFRAPFLLCLQSLTR